MKYGCSLLLMLSFLWITGPTPGLRAQDEGEGPAEDASPVETNLAEPFERRLAALDAHLEACRMVGLSPQDEEELLRSLDELIAKISDAISSSYALSLRSVRDRACCARYFLKHWADYRALESAFEGPEIKFPYVPLEQERVDLWKTETEPLLQDALEYKKNNQSDSWGAKSRFRALLRYPGTPEAERAVKEIEACEKNIDKWFDKMMNPHRTSKNGSREEVVTPPRTTKVLPQRDPSTVEEFQAALRALCSDQISELRDKLRRAVMSYEYDEARALVADSYGLTYSQEELRTQIAILDDYTHDTSMLPLIVKYGATRCVGETMSFGDGLGLDFQGEILDVGLYDVTVYVPATGETRRVHFFELRDDLLINFVGKTAMPEAERHLVSYYMLSNKLKNAQDIISKVTISRPWISGYKYDIDRMEKRKHLEDKLEELERKERKDEKVLERMERRFKPLFVAVNERRFDDKIDSLVISILRIDTDDLTFEVLDELNKVCMRETNRNLSSLMDAAMTQCSCCNGGRDIPCRNCGGKGKYERVKKIAGKPDITTWETCGICNGKGKNACKDCAARVGRKGEFSKYHSFLGHLNSKLKLDPIRPVRR